MKLISIFVFLTIAFSPVAYSEEKSDISKNVSYTKIANDGSELPDGAQLGTNPKDWACTRDNETGLTWEVKTTEGGLHHYKNRYTWYDPSAGKHGAKCCDAGFQNGSNHYDKTGHLASTLTSHPEICKGSQCDTFAFKNAMNAQGLCGAKDWRLPTIGELKSLVYCSDGKYANLDSTHGGSICLSNDGFNNILTTQSPTIDIRYFPNTIDGMFWSSSLNTSTNNNGSPLDIYGNYMGDFVPSQVYFDYGGVGGWVTDGAIAARLVRDTAMAKILDKKYVSNESNNNAEKFVLQMVEYANGHENEFLSAKKNLDKLPKAPKGDKKTARTLNDEALVLLKASNYDDAIMIFDNAHKASPSDIEIANNLASAYEMRFGSTSDNADLENATNALIETLALNSERNLAWADFGRVFTEKEDFESAKNCYLNFYRFSKNKAKTLDYLKNVNQRESNPKLLQVMQSAYAALKDDDKSQSKQDTKTKELPQTESKKPQKDDDFGNWIFIAVLLLLVAHIYVSKKIYLGVIVLFLLFIHDWSGGDVTNNSEDVTKDVTNNSEKEIKPQETDAERNYRTSCSNDYKFCKNNADVINLNKKVSAEISVSCKLAAEKKAISTVDWGGWLKYNFGMFSVGNSALKDGKIVVTDDVAMYQNEFGAKIKKKTRCEYNLREQKVELLWFEDYEN